MKKNVESFPSGDPTPEVPELEKATDTEFVAYILTKLQVPCDVLEPPEDCAADRRFYLGLAHDLLEQPGKLTDEKARAQLAKVVDDFEAGTHEETRAA